MWVLIWITAGMGMNSVHSYPGQPLFFKSESDCRLMSIAMTLEFDGQITPKCIQVAGEVHS